MKKRNLKNVLQLHKTVVVNLEINKMLKGGKPIITDNSCPEICQTIWNVDCTRDGGTYSVMYC